ncbi:MAG: hypothetical protein ISS44_03065 [Candidatus Omnitrophica bacterium]|nr:hypothetical protein [Candidatus Omnitrophota bacterium]
MLKKEYLLIIPIILVGFLLVGCETIPQRTTEIAPSLQALEPANMNRFGDIPVPAGFRLNQEKSFIMESGGVRTGILKYTGKADPTSLIIFYKNQMPIYNWSTLNILQYADQMLNFEKDNESCIITTVCRGNNIELLITLAPKIPLPVLTKPQRRQRRQEVKEEQEKVTVKQPEK